jgi:hypothetical protein
MASAASWGPGTFPPAGPQAQSGGSAALPPPLQAPAPSKRSKGGQPSTSSSSSSSASTTRRSAAPAQESPPGLPRHPLLREVARVELEALFRVQRLRRRLPHSVRWVADRLISTHPLYDVSFASWLATFVCLYHVGFSLMWVLAVNIVVSFLLAWVVGGAVPADGDVRLRPRGRVSPSGFPCVELQITAALLAPVVRVYPQPAVVALCGVYFVLLVLLRLYGLTHFPHQLLASALLGGLSVPALFRLGLTLFPRGLHAQTNLLLGVAVAFIFIGYVAYKAETNEAPIARVPKEECAFARRRGSAHTRRERATRGAGGRKRGSGAQQRS